ncbi:DNA helicase [Tanacetum coccineum]
MQRRQKLDAVVIRDFYKKFYNSLGTPLAANVMRVDCKSQKLKSTDAADVFRAYSSLCSRGIGRRCSVNTCPYTSHGGRNTRGNPKVSLTTGEATCSTGIGGRPSLNVQTTTVSSSNFTHDNDVRNTGPSIRRGARNIRANPKVSLRTGEAIYSRGIGGRRSVNVHQTTTVCSSNFIHNNDTRNTGSSTLRGGRNTRSNPKASLTIADATCSSGISRRRSVRHRPSIRGPTVGSSSVVGTGISYTYTDFGDSGSLCPPLGEAPRFLQLYIYDTDNEVKNKMRHFCGIHNNDLDPQMVEGLIHFLDAYNELVQLFRTARDKCRELDIPEFNIRLYNSQGACGYEFPTSNTLGVMVLESGITSNTNFDVIIQHKDANGHGKARRVTMLAYYRYQLHFRLQQYDLIFRGGKLFQQYVVGVFCAVEQNRLDFLRKKQNYIRADYLSGLYDAISQGERDGYKVGGRIILRIFTAQYPERTASDGTNVVCLVFEQKIQSFVAFLKEERIFRNVSGVLYTVEFQKRGLPHCHTLLWVDSESKIKSAKDVDQYISAELPDLRVDPDVFNIVSETMMNGPCGAANMKASCMKSDKCGKNFPKKINSKTFFDDNGHVHYQRRDTSITTTRNQFKLDNSYVVPYNCDLLLAIRAHINVEYCGWSMLIKPMGESSNEAAPSREMVDEIQNYVEGRFILHLQDMQQITFRDRDRLRSVVDLPGKKNTTLNEWFSYNASNETGRHLSYLEFPSEFVWHSDSKSWSPRRNSKSSIRPLGLLGDDKEWETALEESYESRYTKESVKKVQIPNYHLNADSLQGYALNELEIILNNYGKSLQIFSLPPPLADLLEQLANILLIEERNYNREELIQLKNNSIPRLNAD